MPVTPLHPTILPLWLNAVPKKPKAILREAICGVMDRVDQILSRRDAMTPPARLRVRVGCFASYIRIRRYRAVAEEFVDHLSRIGGLTWRSRMLDIGCGCGQMAAPLTSIIGPEGCYEGFDPDAEAIAWCRERISLRFPHFRFASADLANNLYNPRGSVRPEDFRFPYPDHSFDLILLKSVFTHMPHSPMSHYLQEVRRMLRPRGRCLASFFLLNDEARAGIRAGKSVYAFSYAGEGCFVIDPRISDYVVAHDESLLRETATRDGLQVSDPIYYGAWSGRSDYVSFQDMVLFSRDSDIHGSSI